MFLAARGGGDTATALVIITIGAIGIFIWCIYNSGKKEGIKESISECERRELAIKSREQKLELDFKAAKEDIGRFQEISRKNIDKYREKAREDIRSDKKIEIERTKTEINEYFSIKEGMYLSAKKEFETGFINGRKWLASSFSDLEKLKDDYTESYLRNKRIPAISAANQIKKASKEKREAINRAKILELQLETYKEYFPFLTEYEDYILNDEIKGSSFDDLEEETGKIDRAKSLLTDEEYRELPVSEKNQLALDRYVKRKKSKWEIGRHYERYIGYLYENDGWDVVFFGAIKGLEDMGRDLICKKNNAIHVVQAKCWSKSKTIHEKHIFQLFGTSLLYEIENQDGKTITPVFITTTTVSDVAKTAANWLGIEIKNKDMTFEYPMIKCNISTKDNERVYHLPFDQQYDKVKIDRDGEFYVKTVKEAEDKGFRRAKKYISS